MIAREASSQLAMGFRHLYQRGAISNLNASILRQSPSRRLSINRPQPFPRQSIRGNNNPESGRYGGSSASAGSSDSWYLHDQQLSRPAEEDVVFVPDQPDLSSLDPDVELPAALQELHQLLTEGMASPHIAIPDEIDSKGRPVESSTNRPPIRYIHARAKDMDAWTDWIVVVQVRSSAGGAVSRVAKEAGEFLRQTPPPKDLIPTSLDAFLGAPEAKSRNSNVPSQEDKDREGQAKAHWRPYKIISREAQHGMRVLHANDPEKWNRKELASTFKMSQESVRRILKSKWEPPSSVVSRQNRRVREREEERRKASMEMSEQNVWQSREENEIAKIRLAIDDGITEQVTPTLPHDTNPEKDEIFELEGTSGQPVFYEGLVDASNSTSNQTSSKSRARSGLARGDGEWCLVDAGWCVVHVMSAKARNTYDVEQMYKD